MPGWAFLRCAAGRCAGNRSMSTNAMSTNAVSANAVIGIIGAHHPLSRPPAAQPRVDCLRMGAWRLAHCGEHSTPTMDRNDNQPLSIVARMQESRMVNFALVERVGSRRDTTQTLQV